MSLVSGSSDIGLGGSGFVSSLGSFESGSSLKVKRIIISSPRLNATGNSITSERIARCFITRDDYIISVVDSKIIKELPSDDFDVLIAVHAFWSAHLIKCCRAPIILLLTGTDLNELLIHIPNLKDNDKDETSTKARISLESCKRADAIVVFAKEAKDRFIKVVGDDLGKKVVIIPQAVILPVDEESGLECDVLLDSESSNLRKSVGLRITDRVLLLVCGLRKVKDPLFLMDAIEEWHKRDSTIHLVIVGPVLEEEMTAEVFRRTSLPNCGLVYSPPISRVCLLRWMKQADILVNSSISEGQSNAILEAFLVSTPVVARKNDGNEALIGKPETGLRGVLYSTPLECIEACEKILRKDEIMMQNIQHSLAYVMSEHNSDLERHRWKELVKATLNNRVIDNRDINLDFKIN